MARGARRINNQLGRRVKPGIVTQDIPPDIIPVPFRPYPDGVTWNIQINQASATYTPHPYTNLSNYGNGWVNLETDSFPIWYTTNADPLWTVHVPVNKWRPSGDLSIHAPANMTMNTGGSDNTIVIVNTETKQSYDLYQATSPSSLVINASTYGTGSYQTGNGFGTGKTGAFYDNFGPRATGASGWGGLIEGVAIGKGIINHALALTLPYAIMAPSTATNDPSGFQPPAIACDSNGNLNTGSIKEGMRLAIVPPSRGGPTKLTGLSPLGSMMWDALRDYGAIVADRSPTVGFSADPRSVSAIDIDPVRNWWVSGGGDLFRMWPYMQIVTNYEGSFTYPLNYTTAY